MTDLTQQSTELLFEGPLSLWLLVPIGFALIGLAIWLGRRDFQRTDRPRWVPLLVALRLGALLALLWMVAGPTYVITDSHQSTKSLSFLVDQSASMNLVDPVDESGNNVRWLQETRSSTEELRQLERELGKLATAKMTLQQWLSEPNSIDTIPTTIERTLHESEDTLRSIGQSLPSSFAGQTTALEEIVSQLESNQITSLDLTEIERQLEENNPTPLRAAVTTLDGVVQQLATLTTLLAEQVESQSADNLGNQLEADSTASRTDKIHRFLEQADQSWLADLEEQATISRYQFGETVGPLLRSRNQEISREFDPSTDLTSALQRVALEAAEGSLEAAVIFTDGGHNTGDDPVTIASQLDDTPLFVVPIGNTKIPRDVILHHTLAPRAVYENDLVAVDTMITAYRCSGESLQVELLADDTVVDQQTVTIGREIFDARLQLRWKASSLGRHLFHVRARPLAEEKSEENNKSELAIHVMEDKIRVLIADNMPRWEFRYLVNLFDRDERVEYEQLIFEPRHSSSGRTLPRPTFPFEYADWMRYRVVILGDIRPAQLTLEHQRLLHRYVTEFGGNLVVIAGRESMPSEFANQPLVNLLPVEAGERPIDRQQPYALSVTPEGARTMPIQLETTPLGSETLWRDMSRRLPIYSLSEFSQLKPTGHSLLAANPPQAQQSFRGDPLRSFLSWHYVGRGRVVYLAAPISYQLRYRQGDRYHHRFWGQLLRWAIARDLAEGSRTVRLATDKTNYEQGEAVRVSAALYRLDGSVFSGAAPRVTVIQEGDEIRELDLTENPGRQGTYEGTLNGLPKGKLKLSVSGDPIPALLASEGYGGEIETAISIDPSGALEFRHPLCNLPLLSQIARSANITVLPPTALSAALQQLDLKPRSTESVRRHPIWNQWKYLWIFIGCLTLEWAGRKWIGLV